MFNLPTSRYSISDGHWQRMFPEEDSNLVLTGTSAPVARVFVVEKVPMPDGSYIRTVVAPAIRVLNSSITTSEESTCYVRMYLPVLSAGEAPRLSQSITLTGESLNATTINAVESINVSVGFPNEEAGFNETFFNFPAISQNVEIPSGFDVVLEFYLSEVSVDFGLNY